MNINWNRKYLTIAVYATCAVIISAIAVMVIFNFDSVMSKLSSFGAIVNPIIIGIFCAYLLNPLMMKIEKGMFRKLSSSENKKNRGKARALALTLTMLFVVLILALIIIMVIPQLVENLVSIFNNMDSYIATAKDWLNDIFEDHPQMIAFFGNPLDYFNDFIGKIWKQYSSELMGIAGNVAGMVWAILNTMKDVIIGLTISIYLLARKEMFIGQTKKLIFAFLKVEKAQRFLGVCREASKKFLGSIIGKIIEAFVVALLCFVGTTFMGLPYALLISAIMFVFNLIPYIGPFIGAIPCALLLLLTDDPMQALWFAIFVLILQTVDGNILAPWILGDSTRAACGVDSYIYPRRRRTVRHDRNVPGRAGVRGNLHAVQGFHREPPEEAQTPQEHRRIRQGRQLHHPGIRDGRSQTCPRSRFRKRSTDLRT